MPEFHIIFEGVFDGPTAALAVENARQQIADPRFEPVTVEEET